MNQKSDFDASASMLGYLYQIRYGLYLALKKLPELDNPELYNFSIEVLDDVAFDEDGTALELLQTKFHGNAGNLTNRSPDIWKTIRVWVEALRSGDISLGKTSLTLVTTEMLPKGTIADYLSDGAGRDTLKALELMTEISEGEAKSKANSSGYRAFQSLTAIERKAFVDDIVVIGKSDGFQDVKSKIGGYARQYVPSECVDAFVSRIEGVWFQWCIETLDSSDKKSINLDCLQDFADKIRPEYTTTNLPAEFADVFPDVLEIENDKRDFVRQLRLFNAPKAMMEQAVVNYFRAFEQRTKWSTEGLLEPGELCEYDRRLYEHWAENKAFADLDSDIDSEYGRRKYSAQLYKGCIQNGVIPIRRDFSEVYVAKGSYQILSDQLKIGWHPEYFIMLGESSNEEVA